LRPGNFFALERGIAIDRRRMKQPSQESIHDVILIPQLKPK